MGRFAPEITTVSKPKMKPASAAIREIPKRPSLNFVVPVDDKFWLVCMASF